MEKFKRVGFSLDEEIISMLNKIAKAEDRSMSSVVRRLIREAFIKKFMDIKK